MDTTLQTEIEAAAFRRLLDHLRHRTDVQNIDLMGHAGFCRNCLADWLAEAAGDRGAALDRDAARTLVYGMSYDDYKARYQTKASEEQLQRMNESLEKNLR